MSNESKLKYPFGRDKDKFIHECNKGSLKFYVKNLKLDNPKFAAGNIAMAKECLLYLNSADIMTILEEIEVDHPAFQMCNDAINAITDRMGKKRTAGAGLIKPELPVIQLEPKNNAEIIKEVRLFIDELYKKASTLTRLLDEHTDSGVITRSSDHTPF